jgi:hypothetical protein
MEKHQAEEFAKEWIAAWNSHELEQILSHYEDDFEMSSPAITLLTGEASGKLQGKTAVGEYWAGALKKYPDLRFELLNVARGASSVTLIYQGVLGLSVEVFFFSDSGKVVNAHAHYDL